MTSTYDDTGNWNMDLYRCSNRLFCFKQKEIKRKITLIIIILIIIILIIIILIIILITVIIIKNYSNFIMAI